MLMNDQGNIDKEEMKSVCVDRTYIKRALYPIEIDIVLEGLPSLDI